MKETDLYPPVKSFLERLGYTVKGEIEHCDVVACRDGEDPVIVELKLTLNLKILLQCVTRLSLSPKVYLGVPANSSILKSQRKSLLKLLRMLGLGLLSICGAPGKKCSVQVLLDPCEYQPKKSKRKCERMLGEFVRRVGDPNAGGADRRRGLMTAYRQRTLRVAEFLAANGPTKAAFVSREVDEPEARLILYRDVYGWFERTSPGVYAITPKGNKELLLWTECGVDQ